MRPETRRILEEAKTQAGDLAIGLGLILDFHRNNPNLEPEELKTVTSAWTEALSTCIYLQRALGNEGGPIVIDTPR